MMFYYNMFDNDSVSSDDSSANETKSVSYLNWFIYFS